MGKELKNDFEPDVMELDEVNTSDSTEGSTVEVEENLDLDEFDTQEDEIKIQGGLKSSKVSKFGAVRKNLKWIIGGCVVLLLLLIIGGIKSLNKSDGRNYFDIVDAIVGTQKGTFTYSIDVRVADSNSDKSEDKSVEATEEVVNTETGAEVVDTETDTEVVEELDSQETNKYENSNVDWNNSNGTVTTTERKYLNYKITINGQCSDVEKLNAQFDVSIATEDFSDRFTTVTAVDGKYYIDVEQIRYWLKSSKDAYLIALSESLPEGKTYLVIEDSEFKLFSPYAEDSAKYDSAVKSLSELNNRFVIAEKVIVTNLRNSMGSTGQESVDGVYSLKYTDSETMKKFQNVIADLLYNIGDVHSTIGDALYNNEIVSEEVYKAYSKEEDNIMDAFYKLAVDFKTKNLNTACVGSAREYISGSGVDTYEADWQGQCTIDGVDYIIALNGSRVANAEAVSAPTGSSISLSGYGDELLENTLLSMMDYMIPFNVKVSNKLAITPESITSDMRDDFIELVNSTTAANTRINSFTVYDYINTWANYKVTEDSSESDIVNYNLVADFIKLVNDLTGGAIVVEYQDVDTNQQFYTVDKAVDKVQFIANYDEKNSESKLTVVHLTLMNRSNKEVKIKLSDINLRNLIGSKNPANNVDLIRGYDTEFDTSKLKDEITLKENEFTDVDLYFVTETGLEYFDLYYGDSNLGELIAY